MCKVDKLEKIEVLSKVDDLYIELLELDKKLESLIKDIHYTQTQKITIRFWIEKAQLSIVGIKNNVSKLSTIE